MGVVCEDSGLSDTAWRLPQPVIVRLHCSELSLCTTTSNAKVRHAASSWAECTKLCILAMLPGLPSDISKKRSLRRSQLLESHQFGSLPTFGVLGTVHLSSATIVLTWRTRGSTTHMGTHCTLVLHLGAMVFKPQQFPQHHASLTTMPRCITLLSFLWGTTPFSPHKRTRRTPRRA